jgi:hypothetical protein
VFALESAEQIASVAGGEAGAVIRDHLVGLDAAGRALLRTALDDLDPTPIA